MATNYLLEFIQNNPNMAASKWAKYLETRKEQFNGEEK